MIVCSCANINDRKIREALKGGARTLSDLQSELHVAMGCGRCRETVCEEISKFCGSAEHAAAAMDFHSRTHLTGAVET